MRSKIRTGTVALRVEPIDGFVQLQIANLQVVGMNRIMHHAGKRPGRHIGTEVGTDIPILARRTL